MDEQEFRTGKFKYVRPLKTLSLSRGARQLDVVKWLRATIGIENQKDIQQRTLCFIEEAIELAQVCGVRAVKVHELVDLVAARSVDNVNLEMGQVGVALLALAEAAGTNAEWCEAQEFERVQDKLL